MLESSSMKWLDKPAGTTVSSLFHASQTPCLQAHFLFDYVVLTFSSLKQVIFNQTRPNGCQTVPFDEYIHNLIFICFYFGLSVLIVKYNLIFICFYFGLSVLIVKYCCDNT